ncbi:unnamed protein product [Kuraishia capsulata CBS 1993]|uniref:1,3-beta-glucanosyltransferase n=1 Tax=Kuraishia capsulata CBS 1993 TaxID=1382522 RepID=W6MY17_9ASCO|nr:uncharacterized protein KUCA_T00005849001 [Kuraishia capsulata CBS 1993]CDK29855.1 unnamed protein product [Kuraishia capsulata CBS 1993]
MTLLAAAGIFLVLDVNSPLENSHINRYEPWNSYNKEYLTRIFKVVEQFSGYNNTLAFFAGNEVINDEKSALVSPKFVKAVVRDLKSYIEYNKLRKIPVGYSAADDLNYRVSLAKYLECSNGDSSDSIDFYGVNSYQWCGKQSFHTSGYSILSINSAPRFGCNEVQPRLFEEIQAIYSETMAQVFCGGLVYEYSQEPNNYGLVNVNSDGAVKLRQDFITLKDQLADTPDPDLPKQSRIKSFRQNSASAIPFCKDFYQGLGVTTSLPASPAESIIRQGVAGQKGSFVPLLESDLESHFQVLSQDGSNYGKQVKVSLVPRPNHLALRSGKWEILEFDSLSEFSSNISSDSFS